MARAQRRHLAGPVLGPAHRLSDADRTSLVAGGSAGWPWPVERPGGTALGTVRTRPGKVGDGSQWDAEVADLEPMVMPRPVVPNERACCSGSTGRCTRPWHAGRTKTFAARQRRFMCSSCGPSPNARPRDHRASDPGQALVETEHEAIGHETYSGEVARCRRRAPLGASRRPRKRRALARHCAGRRQNLGGDDE
jgi:hypothetical protein